MIFCGSAAQHFDANAIPVHVMTFPDGELSISINAEIANHDVTYIQSLSHPIHHHVMEMFLTLSLLRQKSPRSITAVIPYFAYGRQNRLGEGGSMMPIQMIADLMAHLGVDRLITMDLHAPEMLISFPVPVLHLSAAPLFADYIHQHFSNEDIVIVSPDAGGAERARDMANHVGCDVVVIDKKRIKPGVTEAVSLAGDVQGKTCIIVDDMIDSGDTMITAVNALVVHGAIAVHAMATHAIFSGDAVMKLSQSDLRSIIITNTIQHERLPEKFRVLDVWPLMK